MKNSASIKVAWVCSLSNPIIRGRITTKASICKKIVYRIIGKAINNTDSAIWNTNAIKELEQFEDVELHVICPVRGLKPDVQRVVINGVFYYFFREENSSIISYFIHQLFNRYDSEYRKNRRYISSFINEIKPDIIHVIGAENPHYALSVLDMPNEIPTMLQLQALLISLVEETEKKEERKSFYYKGLIEQKIIRRSNYIGTSSALFSSYILQHIKPNATILSLPLAMVSEVSITDEPKQFDFVYFAVNIEKACEDALEAYIVAQRKRNNITLDIVGGYSKEFKSRLDERIKECRIGHLVTFEGLLPTHDDVIEHIRKARVALLPLKMDLVPNTVHEAMSNGIPVVTTITAGTPKLNRDRQSVLLSEQGDYESLSNNMLNVLEDNQLYDRLKQNAAITEKGRKSNKDVMLKWRDAYYACIDNYKSGEEIPDYLLFKENGPCK